MKYSLCLLLLSLVGAVMIYLAPGVTRQLIWDNHGHVAYIPPGADATAWLNTLLECPQTPCTIYFGPGYFALSQSMRIKPNVSIVGDNTKLLLEGNHPTKRD